MIGKTIKKFVNDRIFPCFKLATLSALKSKQLQYTTLIGELDGWLRSGPFLGLSYDPARMPLLASLLGTTISEAYYIIDSLQRSLACDGDICEFGIAQGATSALLAHEMRTTTKQLWLFDSFKGLSKPDTKDQLIDDIFNLKSMEKYEGTMAFGMQEATRRLHSIGFPIERVMIVPGFIEESLNKEPLPSKVCFAYIDFDLYKPIKRTLQFLDTRLSQNGFVVVDDYGFLSSGVKSAVDEFVSETGGCWHFVLPPAHAGHFCILQRTAAPSGFL